MRNRFRRGVDARSYSAASIKPQKIEKSRIDTWAAELAAIEKASKRAARSRIGNAGDIGIRVWRYIAYGFVAKGRACFCSYQAIADALGVARSAVGEAIRRLRRIGALVCVRRWKTLKGRRVRDTNAYEIARPTPDAKRWPVLKRIRGVKEKAKAGAKILADAAKSLAAAFSKSAERTAGVPEEIKTDGIAISARPHAGYSSTLMGSRLVAARPVRGFPGFSRAQL